MADNKNISKNFSNPNSDNLDYTLGESEPFKEAPYYMKEDWRNQIFEKCFKRYDEFDKYFIKIFALLLIQYILISFFTLLGLNNGWNKFFIQSTKSMLWTAGPITLLISFLCYGVLYIKGSDRKDKLLYIYLGLYIPCIILYCFLLSQYTDRYNIMLVIYIISIDFFGLLLYVIIFTIKDRYLFLIAPAVTSTIMILIFHFRWKLNPVITIKISSVLLSAIIYIGIISAICKNSFDTEYYLFATIIFNLAIFAPVAFLVFIALIILAMAFSNEKDKKKKN